MEFSFFFSFVCLCVTAGAYYPAQPQFTPPVAPAPVLMNPAPQQQQAPPPPQHAAPAKRERKQVSNPHHLLLHSGEVYTQVRNTAAHVKGFFKNFFKMFVVSIVIVDIEADVGVLMRLMIRVN